MRGSLLAQFESGINQGVDSSNAGLYPQGIDVSGCDAILVSVDLIPGNTNIATKYYVYAKDPSGAGVHVGQNEIPALMWHAAFGWGPGCSYSYNGMNGIAAALPSRIAIVLEAPGPGVKTVTRVWGCRVGDPMGI